MHPSHISHMALRNPGVRTIEEELLEALCKAEAFPEDMRDNLGKVRNTGCLQAPLCNKRQPLQRPEFCYV